MAEELLRTENLQAGYGKKQVVFDLNIHINKGEIVAAMIDGEATVKTFTKKDGHIWLMPANDVYKPINGDNAEILGIVTAVLRSLR